MNNEVLMNKLIELYIKKVRFECNVLNLLETIGENSFEQVQTDNSINYKWREITQE